MSHDLELPSSQMKHKDISRINNLTRNFNFILTHFVINTILNISHVKLYHKKKKQCL